MDGPPSDPPRAPDPLDEVLRAARALPSWWRRKPVEEGFLSLRCHLQYTQDEVAARSGLAQSIVSRLEGGGDALLSTWTRAYAAMGFELLLVPVSSLTARGLRDAAEAGRPPGSWVYQRAKPRPHRKRAGPPEDVPAGPVRGAAA